MITFIYIFLDFLFCFSQQIRFILLIVLFLVIIIRTLLQMKIFSNSMPLKFLFLLFFCKKQFSPSQQINKQSLANKNQQKTIEIKAASIIKHMKDMNNQVANIKKVQPVQKDLITPEQQLIIFIYKEPIKFYTVLKLHKAQISQAVEDKVQEQEIKDTLKFYELYKFLTTFRLLGYILTFASQNYEVIITDTASLDLYIQRYDTSSTKALFLLIIFIQTFLSTYLENSVDEHIGQYKIPNLYSDYFVDFMKIIRCHLFLAITIIMLMNQYNYDNWTSVIGFMIVCIGILIQKILKICFFSTVLAQNHKQKLLKKLKLVQRYNFCQKMDKSSDDQLQITIAKLQEIKIKRKAKKIPQPVINEGDNGNAGNNQNHIEQLHRQSQPQRG